MFPRGVFFIKSRKIKVLALTYSIALITAMGFYGYTGNRGLEGYRLAALYSSERAFEETVNSVDILSRSLEKSLYATDTAMRSRLCGEIYASAAAAESAMSTLPFTTHELEKLSAFLNVAGDYAHALSGVEAEGFDKKELDTLAEFSGTAGEFYAALESMRDELNGGDIMMDSREKRLMNVGVDENAAKLSDRLLDYEKGISELKGLEYEGKYGKTQREEAGELNETEMKELAAEFAGVEPGALKLEYEYEGTSGRQCYSVDELLICVSPSGVETMGQSRLVSESRMELEEAERRAKKFLADRGYDDLELSSIRENGAVALMRFSKTADGAVCIDKNIDIGIAMDDGSVYSFNAESYGGEAESAEWTMGEKQAARALPDTLHLEESRKVIKESAGGNDLACYEFTCSDEEGKSVVIYVDAESGLQQEIKVN